MSLLRAVDRFWRAEVPAERLAVLRVLIGGFATFYLAVRFPILSDFGSFSTAQFEPVGPARVLDAPLPTAATRALTAAALLACAACTVGWRYRVTAPAAALLFLWVTSYRNSFGMVFHVENLPALHLVVLGLVPAAADTLSLDARQGRCAAPATPSSRYGWPIRLLCAVTLATYFIAGVAKLRNSGWTWMEGEILRNYIAYDALRKMQLGSIHSPLAPFIVRQAWLFPIIGWLTMLIELGAPFALLHATLGRVWVALAYTFHLGVLAMMAIAFPYPMCGVAFASFFRVERLLQWRPVRRLTTAAKRLLQRPAAGGT